MNVLRAAFLGCLLTGLLGCGTSPTGPTPVKPGAPGGTPTSKPASAEKVNKDKLVGTWELTRSESGGNLGTTFEFANDGKLKRSLKETTVEGTYAVDGDRLTTSTKSGDKETVTITRLTDSELVLKDENGKTEELKKK